MIKNLTCIICPVGCKLETEVVDSKVTNISGYACSRGRDYGISECLHPVRMLTTTVYAGEGKVLPVRTNTPVPKEKLMECMDTINHTRVVLPIEIGSVIIENIAGTGADVIASKNMR